MKLFLFFLLFITAANASETESSANSESLTKNTASQLSVTQENLGSKKLNRPGIINGLRLGLTKSMLQAKSKAPRASGIGIVGKRDTRNNLGAFIGYSKVNNYDFGFDTKLGYQRYNIKKGLYETDILDTFDDYESYNAIKLDANLTYGFLNNYYAKAGINLQRLIGTENTDFHSGFGHQLGLGAQANNTWGAELNFITIQHYKGNDPLLDSIISANSTINLRMSGIELSVHAVF